MRVLLFATYVTIFLMLPISASALLPTQIVADFSTVSGYVIMPVGDEFLIDLDASANLKEGDILTLITPGEKVIHPISKEVLGSLDIPSGYLEVTRIKSGYSYAKLLISEIPVQKGAQIKRFEQVPAKFIDLAGNGAEIFTELKTGLPQLNWREQDNSTNELLIFTLTSSALNVSAPPDRALASYPVTNGTLIASSPTPSVQNLYESENKSEPKFLQKAANSIINSIIGNPNRDPNAGVGIIRKDADARAGIWMGPNLEGEATGITVTDLNGDGKNDIILAMDNRLLIANITDDKFTIITEINVKKGMQILSIDAFDLDNNNHNEIYVSAIEEENLSSFVLEYSDGNYNISIDSIPWFLRVVHLVDGPALLGQQLSRYGTGFEMPAYLIVREQNKLHKGAELVLPQLSNIYSVYPFKDDSDQLLYAYLSTRDYLNVVSANGKQLWESGDYYGGSETRFDRKHNKAEIGEQIYIQSRIIPSPSGGILVAQNEGLRSLQRYRKFKESRILSLKWNGHSMQEEWRTSQQNGYLSDFTVADVDNDGQEEIVMLMKFTHRGTLQEPLSAVVTYKTK